MIIFTVLNNLREDSGLIDKLTLPKQIPNLDIYYGINVSSSLRNEPIDQLDGFLIAKYLQQRVPSNFYVFIAGVYGAFNAQTPEEAEKIVRNKKGLEESKKKLLENVMDNLKLNGRVYTTYDLWRDEDYWKILNEIEENIDPEKISQQIRKKGMPMKEFPRGILGKGEEVLNGNLSRWSSTAFYVPAEVAEAIWFNRKLGVSFKIGPVDSEEIYDNFISRYGLGIIGMNQPISIERGKLNERLEFTPPAIRSVVPYIGREDQNRISFSDNPAEIAVIRSRNTPSFNRSLRLSELYQILTSGKQKSPAFSIFDLVKLGENKR